MLIKFLTKQITLSYCLKGFNVSWNKIACLLTVEGSLVSTWKQCLTAGRNLENLFN